MDSLDKAWRSAGIPFGTTQKLVKVLTDLLENLVHLGATLRKLYFFLRMLSQKPSWLKQTPKASLMQSS